MHPCSRTDNDNITHCNNVMFVDTEAGGDVS